MEHQPGIVVSNNAIAGLAALLSVVTVAAGIWMLARQGIYIDTGTDATGLPERSFNWWGLGIGTGLIAGGIAGLLGLALRSRVFLIGAGFMVAFSALWHPVFWPLFGGVLLLLILGGTEFSAAPRRSTVRRINTSP